MRQLPFRAAPRLHATPSATALRVAIAAAGLLAASSAQALCIPSGVPGFICPDLTTGKEYSTRPDTDATGLPASLQTLLWVGGEPTALPASAQNGFNYGPAGLPWGREVDAMANTADHLYYHVLPGKSVDRDEVHLLFNVGNESVIRWETPGFASSNIWGTPPVAATDISTQSVDALEVWGGNGLVGADANRFSLVNDAQIGWSVFGYDRTNGAVIPWITTVQIANAIDLDLNYLGQLDVDALMVGDFDKYLLFSIAPIVDAAGKTVFDGGEIWTWKLADPKAKYLDHGNHLWDTDFDVALTYGLTSENVTVLEAVDVSAVPEPQTWALLLAGIAGLASRSRRRLG